MSEGLTPSQTVGPFLAIGLPWPDGPFVVPSGTPGAVRIRGQVVDGGGEPIPDALIETWQADPDGRFAHPTDPRWTPTAEPGPASRPAAGSQHGSQGWRGFGRCPTDETGWYQIVTLVPGTLPCPDGQVEAPHIDVSVFARGLLDRVVTRIYFPDQESANAADPVLRSIDPARRPTLIATAAPAAGGAAGDLRFDIHLRGPRETVFFDV